MNKIFTFLILLIVSISIYFIVFFNYKPRKDLDKLNKNEPRNEIQSEVRD